MRFLRSDDELALVLAHETAHTYRGQFPISEPYRSLKRLLMSCSIYFRLAAAGRPWFS
jgi:hypothetical protein